MFCLPDLYTCLQNRPGFKFFIDIREVDEEFVSFFYLSEYASETSAVTFRFFNSITLYAAALGSGETTPPTFILHSSIVPSIGDLILNFSICCFSV